VDLSEAAVIVSFSVDPVTLVDVSVWVSESTFAIVFLVLSLSLIESSILKFDFTDSFPLSDLFSVVLTFVCVFGAIWVSDVGPVVVPDVE